MTCVGVGCTLVNIYMCKKKKFFSVRVGLVWLGPSPTWFCYHRRLWSQNLENMISLDPYRCSKPFRKGIFVSHHVLRVVRVPKISSVNSALIKGLKALFNHSETRAVEPLLLWKLETYGRKFDYDDKCLRLVKM